MLELYHGGNTTCSRKARLCLREKGVSYVSRFLSLQKFQQHEPAYLAVNPQGLVPALVDNGVPIIESMLINEYVDERFEGPALRPGTPIGKAHMRLWTKLADTHGPAAIVPHTWSRFRSRFAGMEPAEFDRLMVRIPLKERRDRYRKAAEGAFGDADRQSADDAARLIVARMEAALGDGDWLMGRQYTLADIDLFPFVDRFDAFHPDVLNPTTAPKVSAWVGRMRARPAVIAVWATSEAPEQPDGMQR